LQLDNVTCCFPLALPSIPCTATPVLLLFTYKQKDGKTL